MDEEMGSAAERQKPANGKLSIRNPPNLGRGLDPHRPCQFHLVEESSKKSGGGWCLV
jgi:hypothetical protein